MKRVMMILATAAFASALAVGAADARGGGGGGGGGGHGGGFGGGGHMGGFGGGAHMGGIGGGAHVGGLGGGVHAGGMAMRGDMGPSGGDHLGLAEHSLAHGTGIHDHAMNHYGRYRPGYGYYGGPDCYDWYVLHPDQPLPLSCT